MSTYAEVRYVALRLSECLTDVLWIAESRGLCLPEPCEDTDEDTEEEDGAPTPPTEAAG